MSVFFLFFFSLVCCEDKRRYYTELVDRISKMNVTPNGLFLTIEYLYICPSSYSLPSFDIGLIFREYGFNRP